MTWSVIVNLFMLHEQIYFLNKTIAQVNFVHYFCLFMLHEHLKT
jgi:hypothetical protein